jgi:hypothetical protein
MFASRTSSQMLSVKAMRELYGCYSKRGVDVNAPSKLLNEEANALETAVKGGYISIIHTVLDNVAMLNMKNTGRRQFPKGR